jgi:hypothetical protein
MRLDSCVVRMLISAGLITTVHTPVARAGAWSTAGQGSIGINYDSNARLSAVDEVADNSAVADVSAALSYQDDAFVFRASPRLVAVRYDHDRSLNRTEQYLTLQSQNTTEQGSGSLTVSGTQNTTLTSEPGFTDRAQVNKQHREADFSINHSRDLTERFSLSGQLTATLSRYVDAESTGLIDYDYGSAGLSSSYDWSTRSRLILQASMGKLQVPHVEAYDKTNLSATLGYRLQISPRWTTSISFGPSQIRTPDRVDNGTVYNVTLAHESLLTNFNFSLTRDVTPNGFGLLSRHEQVRLGLTRALGERWSTDWTLSASRNQNVLPEGGVEQERVTYGDLSGALRWRMTPTWSVAIAAGYSAQHLSNDAPAAERTHGSLNITWNGLTRSLH